MRRARAALAVALLAAACVKMPPTGDAGAGDSDALPVRAQQVHFVFRNDRARPIYVASSSPFWQLVRGGIVLPAHDTCDVCNCDSCSPCLLCATSPVATVDVVRAGQALEFDWPGLVYPVVPNGCRAGLACESPQIAAPGPLTLRVQYSLTSEPDPISGGVGLGPTLTVEATFVHPPAAPVVVSAQ